MGVVVSSGQASHSVSLSSWATREWSHRCQSAQAVVVVHITDWRQCSSFARASWLDDDERVADLWVWTVTAARWFHFCR